MMEFRKVQRGRWRWELAPEFWPVESELFSQLQDPKKDFRARLIFRQGKESWFETKVAHPRLPALVWIRLRDYTELSSFNFIWRSSRLEKSFQVMSQLSPQNSALARPYAYGRRRKGWRIEREAVVFEPLTHFQPLSRFLRENFDWRRSRNSREDKKELIAKLTFSLREIFLKKILPGPDSRIDDLLCRLEQDLRIVFRLPEQIQLPDRKPESLVSFLAWLYLELRPCLPKTYLLRFLRDFLQTEGLNQKQISSKIQEIFISADQILDRKIKKMKQDFWRKKLSFFWFEIKGARIFVHYSLDQNQVLELIPSLALLSRKREKVRVKPIGEKEPIACDLTAIPGRRGPDHPVSRAFLFSLRLELENIPHQAPLVGVESSRGDFLISLPLSSTSMGLNEYLARLLADELSGRSGRDRKFLLRLAHLLLTLHERGLVYEQPQGDEIWVEELPEGRMNFYLAHLERLRAVGQLEAEFAGKNLFEIFSSLPLSEPDSLVILEEYLRHTRKFQGLKTNFTEYLHLIRRARV